MLARLVRITPVSILINIIRFIRQRSPRLLSLLLILCTTILLLWNFTPPAFAQTATTPETCRMGVYLLSLRDFNTDKNSFNAEFWIWSVCPSKNLKPLETLEIINATDTKAAYDSVTEKKDLYGGFVSQEKVYWSQRKITTTLDHNWDAPNYPFDRHVLEIPLEEALYDSSAFVYTPDQPNSNYKNSIKLDGWKITNFSFTKVEVPYKTTFGDPELPIGKSTYSRMNISISIERDTISNFFKLIAGVYVAFAISLLSFFYDSGKTSLLNARATMIVGSLLITLLNIGITQAILGHSEKLSLVDKIHITTLIYIFVAAIITVCSRLIYETGREKLALRFDRQISFSLFFISFIIVNAILIQKARIG